MLTMNISLLFKIQWKQQHYLYTKIVYNVLYWREEKLHAQRIGANIHIYIYIYVVYQTGRDEPNLEKNLNDEKYKRFVWRHSNNTWH
jgi:hypothetical protein